MTLGQPTWEAQPGFITACKTCAYPFTYPTSETDGVFDLESFLNAQPSHGFIETDAPSQRNSGFFGWNVSTESVDFEARTISEGG